jgi:hypothetical protein
VSDMDRIIAGNVIPGWTDELTEDQLAELKAAFERAMSGPYRYRWLYKGRWRKALPLPWYTRLRLWLTHQRDSFAIWLCDHDQVDAAEALWRLTGAWRRRAG